MIDKSIEILTALLNSPDTGTYARERIMRAIELLTIETLK